MKKIISLVAIAAMTLAACGGPTSGDSATPTDSATPGATGSAGADAPRVIAAFYPLQWASSQVVGPNATVDSLTLPGAEPHDLELTPQQVASLADADLVVYLKDFQPSVDSAIEQAGAKNVLDVGTLVDLQPLPADAEEDHEHADGEAEEGEEHEHGDFDPHFWQDPERMEKVVTGIQDSLDKIAPEQKDAFAANAKSAISELQSIDNEFTTGLASCARSEFITTHEAFGYLAKRFNLVQIGISGINPNEEPSPSRIAEVQAEAKKYGITTIFFETLTSPAVAKSIAGDLGLKTAVLDPIEGVTADSPGTDYPSIMRANLKELQSANDCK